MLIDGMEVHRKGPSHFYWGESISEATPKLGLKNERFSKQEDFREENKQEMKRAAMFRHRGPGT